MNSCPCDVHTWKEQACSPVKSDWMCFLNVCLDFICYLCRFWLLPTPQTPMHWSWRSLHHLSLRKTLLVWQDWIITELWARFLRDWMSRFLTSRMLLSGEIIHRPSTLMLTMQLWKHHQERSLSASLLLMMLGMKMDYYLFW